MHIYINYLNNFLVDRRIKAGASLRSRFREFAIAEPSVLGALWLFAIFLSKVKSSSGSLEVVEPHRAFFWQVAIFFKLEPSRRKKALSFSKLGDYTIK